VSVWRWPFDIIPSQQVWRLISRAATAPSPLSAFSQTVSRTGPFWACELAFQNLDGMQRERLISFLNQVGDQSDVFYLPDLASAQTASALQPDNIVANGNFLTLTSWSKTDANLDIAGGWGRVVNTHATNLGRIYQQLTFSSTARYTLSGNLKLTGANVKVMLGTTVGGSEVTSLTVTTSGAFNFPFDAPGGATLYLTLENQGTTVGNTFWVSNVACEPGLRVDADAIDGNIVRVTGHNHHGTASQDRALGVGEMVAFQYANYKFELKRLTVDHASDLTAGAEGYLLFEPPMRNALAANNTAWLGTNAGARMRLAGPGYDRADVPGIFTDINVSCIEAFE